MPHMHTSCSAVKPLETYRPSTWPSIVCKNSLSHFLPVSWPTFLSSGGKMRQAGSNSPLINFVCSCITWLLVGQYP